MTNTNLLFDFPTNDADNLLKKFEEIHDYIYSHDGLSPQQTLEEFVKVLFIKILDESSNVNTFNIALNEWKDLQAGGQAPLFVDRITALFDKTKQAFLDIFDADDRIKISPMVLGFTINKLQNVSLLHSLQDAKGLAFQKFLSHHEKDSNGQFFTPTPVIDFCVKILSPKPDEVIIDPACGSGGFLISALNYFKANFPDFAISTAVSGNIFGLDINKSIARIAKMKLLLEANVKTNVFCLNSLGDLDSLKLSISRAEGFDIVLTNPPFGAKITSSTTLTGFALGHKWSRVNDSLSKTNKPYQSQNAEILFIERCLQLLKEGGRLAIVLPNGNFENPSLEYLRQFIRQQAKILAIINLPSETFIPFGTGVKTSLMFLEKTSNNSSDYPIFFGRVTKLGYQGNKNGTPLYKKDQYGQLLRDASGLYIFDEDFSEIISAYQEFTKGCLKDQSNAFVLKYSDLQGRFDFDFYSPETRKMFSAMAKYKTVRLGDICDIVKVKSSKLKDKSLSIDYVELSDVNTHSYEIINSTTYQMHELPSRASYEIQEGDVITAIAGNSVGTRKHATALVTKEFAGCICTNGFRVLRNFTIDPYYFLYFCKSSSFLHQMFMYRTGAAIPNVSDSDLAEILIYLPSDSEIEKISHVMKQSFQLREDSKKLVEAIACDFA